MHTSLYGTPAGAIWPLSLFPRIRAESARLSALRESARHLRRAQFACKCGDYRAARRAACKALAAANTAKSESRSEIFQVLNACQAAARADRCRKAQTEFGRNGASYV